MIGWIVVAVAAAAAVVILGFATYEISWKVHRLNRDLAGLKQVRSQLNDAHRQLTALAARIQAVQAGRTRS